METDKPGAKILKILLKDLSVKPTTTSLAENIGMSRVGAWKVLKRLEAQKLIILSPAGTGKTSTYSISLNWENPLAEKTLALALIGDALKNPRWRSNFAELEAKVGFLIIYGSIMHSPREAKDIDLLSVVPNQNKFLEIEESIKKIQKTQAKKIHILSFTQKELKDELEKPNKVFIDALKRGVVLFGQENFIRFMKELMKR